MPSPTHYDQLMLRGARSVPVLHRLGGGTIATVAEGQPWRILGDSAVVYQLRQPSGRLLAVRCFLADVIDERLAARYRALASEPVQRDLRAAAASPMVGGLAFWADGITETLPDLRSVTLPVVTMDWVMGPTLTAAVQRACQARDGATLARLAEAWRAACLACAETGLVHGDLDGENILVRPGPTISFVDYDTALWPDAPGVPSPSSNPAYRHPRGATTDPVRRDEFAAFLLYASLRILSRWPELREDHGDPPQQRGGALLFRQRDLASPDGSALFGKIRVLDDPFVQSLAGILRETCRGKPDDTPSFVDALAMANNVARRVSPAPSPNVSPPVATPPNATPVAPAPPERRTRVSTLTDSGDQWGGRPEPRSQPTRSSTPVVEWLEPQREPGTAAREADAARLRDAVDAADLATVERLWAGLRNTAEGGPFAVAINELRATAARAEVRQALIGRDDATLVDAVDRATDRGVPLSVESRRESRAAALRLDVAFELERALQTGDGAALVDLALSGDLDELPQLDDEAARRVIGALKATHLVRALGSDDDGVILQALGDEAPGAADGLTDEQRRRVDLARQRVAWRSEVREALRTRDGAGVARLHVHAPEGAIQLLSDGERRRVDRLQRHGEAVLALRRAVDDADDPGIVDAFRVIETLGVPLGDAFPWLQLRDVVDRYSIIAAVRRAAGETPRDYDRLARLLPQLRQATGEERPYLGEGLSYETLEADIRRNAQVGRIREALRSDDDRTIVTAALPDLFGAVALLTRSEQGRIERASAAVDRAMRRSTRPQALGQMPSASHSSDDDETT